MQILNHIMNAILQHSVLGIDQNVNTLHIQDEYNTGLPLSFFKTNFYDNVRKTMLMILTCRVFPASQF